MVADLLEKNSGDLILRALGGEVDRGGLAGVCTEGVRKRPGGEDFDGGNPGKIAVSNSGQ